MDNHDKILDFVADQIKPYYFMEIVAWILNNCEIEKRDDVPHILGGASNPIQRALTDYICQTLNIK